MQRQLRVVASLVALGVLSGCAAPKREDARATKSAPAAPGGDAKKEGPPSPDDAKGILEEEAPAEEEFEPAPPMAPGAAPAPAAGSGRGDATIGGAKPGDGAQPALLAALTELESLEGQLRSAGVAVPGPTRSEGFATRSSGKKAKRKRSAPAKDKLDCEKVKTLRTAICDLADRICGLEKQHPGQEEYVAACERAREDCSAAQGADEKCGQ